MEINQKFLESMYLKAKQAFINCIQNKDNEYLQSEINFPISKTILKEEFVKLEFSKNEFNKFVIEIKHLLISPTDEVFGYYTLYENESGEALDDNLVFNSDAASVLLE